MKTPKKIDLGYHFLPKMISSSDKSSSLGLPEIQFYNYANARLRFRTGIGEYKFEWNDGKIYYGMPINKLREDAYKMSEHAFFSKKIVRDLIEDFDVVFITSKLDLTATSLFCFAFENKSEYLYWRLALE